MTNEKTPLQIIENSHAEIIGMTWARDIPQVTPRHTEIIKAVTLDNGEPTEADPTKHLATATIVFWAKYGDTPGYRVVNLAETAESAHQLRVVSSMFAATPVEKVKPVKAWVADVMSRPKPAVTAPVPVPVRTALVGSLDIDVMLADKGGYCVTLSARDRTGGISWELEMDRIFETADQALAEGAIEAHVRQPADQVCFAEYPEADPIGDHYEN